MSATDWIGRSETAHDHLSHNLLKRIAATFGEAVPADGEAVPPLWQWCFFQDPLPESALGGDGHPARGGFLPPADNRNRMWAGGVEGQRVAGRLSQGRSALGLNKSTNHLINRPI